MRSFSDNQKKMFLENYQLKNGRILSVEYYPGKKYRRIMGTCVRGYGAFFAVQLMLTPEPGSCIRVTAGLPLENWNGKFLGMGNGGGAGQTAVANVRRGVALGYATAHTDLGTSLEVVQSVAPAVFLKDFGYRATHLMTVAVKKLAEDFYGRKISHSFFYGVSTGGQQCLSEAQRYPEDYDGILCFAPAYDRVNLHIQFAWSLGLMNYGGKPQFTPEELDAIAKRLILEYAEVSGSAPGDTFLSYPDRIDRIDYSIFQDDRMQLRLKAQQIELLKKIHEGAADQTNKQSIYEGVTLGAENQPLSLPDMRNPNQFSKDLLFPFLWARGQETDLLHFDFHQDTLWAREELSPVLDAVNPNLSPFKERGGKLLMIHGTADAAIPYMSSVRYYEQVVEKQESLDRTMSFFRLFLVPGLGHGCGGPGFQDIGDIDYLITPKNGLYDPLIALDEWVCQGIAPEMLIARSLENGNILKPKPVQKRPVFCYPYTTKYVSGDPGKPESFQKELYYEGDR